MQFRFNFIFAFNKQFLHYFYLNLLVTAIIVINVCDCTLCPDGHRDCESDWTCCKLQSGSYGCCPLPSAQCCSDGVHCCPNATKCNDKEGTCDEPTLYRNRVELTRYDESKLSELCPDRREQCASDETCCKEKSGVYGCCMFRNAVCCSDGEHCCPYGTKCDVIHGLCVRVPIHQQINYVNTISVDSMKSIRVKHNTTDVICTGGRYKCPDYNTCCRVSDDEWACCPLPNAVCCDDRIHCCPQNTRCTPNGCEQQKFTLHYN